MKERESHKMEEDTWSKSKDLAHKLAQEESNNLNTIMEIDDSSTSKNRLAKKGGFQTKLGFKKKSNSNEMSVETTPDKSFKSFKTKK